MAPVKIRKISGNAHGRDIIIDNGDLSVIQKAFADKYKVDRLLIQTDVFWNDGSETGNLNTLALFRFLLKAYKKDPLSIHVVGKSASISLVQETILALAFKAALAKRTIFFGETKNGVELKALFFDGYSDVSADLLNELSTADRERIVTNLQSIEEVISSGERIGLREELIEVYLEESSPKFSKLENHLYKKYWSSLGREASWVEFMTPTERHDAARFIETFPHSFEVVEVLEGGQVVKEAFRVPDKKVGFDLTYSPSASSSSYQTAHDDSGDDIASDDGTEDTFEGQDYSEDDDSTSDNSIQDDVDVQEQAPEHNSVNSAYGRPRSASIYDEINSDPLVSNSSSDLVSINLPLDKQERTDVFPPCSGSHGSKGGFRYNAIPSKKGGNNLHHQLNQVVLKNQLKDLNKVSPELITSQSTAEQIDQEITAKAKLEAETIFTNPTLSQHKKMYNDVLKATLDQLSPDQRLALAVHFKKHVDPSSGITHLLAKERHGYLNYFCGFYKRDVSSIETNSMHTAIHTLLADHQGVTQFWQGKNLFIKDKTSNEEIVQLQRHTDIFSKR